MKLRLEHDLPRRLRYAKVYFEAGSASVSLSVDGTAANWQASIGRKKANSLGMSDKEYVRFRVSLPILEMLDDNGEVVTVRDAKGYEEQWRRPRWELMALRKTENSKS